MVKQNTDRVPKPLFNPAEKYVVDPKLDFNEEFCQELSDEGLKLISEGKLAAFINLSGFHLELNLDEPRALNIPPWPKKLTILEFFIQRIKGVGQQAVRTFGKNYSKKREPILLFIEVNEMHLDEVDKFLMYNKYFGYQGVICFATVRGDCNKLIGSDAQLEQKREAPVPLEGSVKPYLLRLRELPEVTRERWAAQNTD